MLGVDIRHVKVLFLGVFIQLLDFEVDIIGESVPRDLTTFLPVGPVREDTNDNFGYFGSVSLDIGDNFRLVEYRFPTNLSADSVDFCDLRNDFLETSIYFSELLHPLLVVELRSHLSFKFLFGLSALFFQRQLLFSHLRLELFLLLRKLPL